MSVRTAIFAAALAATASTAFAGDVLVIELTDAGTIPAATFTDHCTGFDHTAPKYICKAALTQAEMVRPVARPDITETLETIELAAAQ